MEVRKSSRTTSLGYSWCWVRHPYRLPVGRWIARHSYLGALQCYHSWPGVLFWSGFPPPWSAEVTPNCFIVRDADRQQLAYVYYENEPGRRSAAKLLTKDEARRIARNIAKLPELLIQATSRRGTD